jgi:putative SOS response-associated peptidase YedK
MTPNSAHSRFNIAPSQPILAAAATQEGRGGRWFRWGLIPTWAKDAKIGYRTLNAQVETAQFAAWLDPALQASVPLQTLIDAAQAPVLTAYPVTRRMNNPRSDQPDAITPLTDPCPGPDTAR